jgi:hypothetical protein
MGQNNMTHRRRSDARSTSAGFATRKLGVVALVLLLVAIGLLIRALIPEERHVPPAGALKSVARVPQEPADASSEIDGKYYGLCRKNSIHSVGDFYNTVRNDPVLKAHFSGFNWDTARLGKQESDVWTYVSYRKGDEIYRTSKAVKLPKGDGYVTDGTRIVRTFCCNDYVLATPSPRPVERVDAPPRRMQRKPDAADGFPEQQASPAPTGDAARGVPESLENVPSDSDSQRYFGPGRSGSSHPFDDPLFTPYSSSKNPNDHVVTPEPGTVVLVGAGVGLFILFFLLRRKRSVLH